MSEKKSFNDIPEITQHSISDFLYNEEASIPKSRLMAIGTLMVLLAFAIASEDAFAAHRSHSSHRSHRSHSSHSSGSHSNHTSHSNYASHSSHTSHTSHISHTSHSSADAYATQGHSNAALRTNPTPVPTQTPVPSTLIKTPQYLPDTIPPD